MKLSPKLYQQVKDMDEELQHYKRCLRRSSRMKALKEFCDKLSDEDLWSLLGSRAISLEIQALLGEQYPKLLERVARLLEEAK